MSLLGLDPNEPYADRTDLDSLADQASPMARLLLGDVRERFGMLDRPVRDYLDYLKEFDQIEFDFLDDVFSETA